MVKMIIFLFFALVSFAVRPSHQTTRCDAPIVTAKFCNSPTSVSVIPQVISSPVMRLIKTDFIPRGSCCSDGPESPPLPVLQAPSVTLPAIEGPIVALPSPPIPAPRVLAQRCICTKTVVKPQLIQREITIPKIKRFLKRTYTPVIENIAYKTRAVPCKPCCDCCNKCSNYHSRVC
ncbi:hypothetical protein Phum_PHUM145900 [Pediculus humanus corporis]|uniref:Uncharacterized protein n=1 Tax=Pediculus humanus subsp. corporis TaxID=121224 RepID=E0VF46_PEDHC|nr:uncharacterized protein Phum_PHUM145900 [Pediculus humanus corporis]EEB11935.1 hypothetical protein Phum_PHUM145900 [Pediculus humanus corporis]